MPDRLATAALAATLVAAAALPAGGRCEGLGPGMAPAAHQPETRKFRYSPYEEATIAGALASLGLTLDPAPEGKVVEAVDTVRLEVIEPRDPAPRFLNLFHHVTRDYVVLR